MRVLITGATGFIGSHIVQMLLNKGHQIVAVVRCRKALAQHWPEIEVIELDFAQTDNSTQWLKHLHNINTVINCVGIIREQGKQTFATLHTKAPMALFQACEQAKVEQVIQISALGAATTALSEYHRSKAAADSYLSTLNLNGVILKPSIVYGPGAKSTALFKGMVGLPITPLIDSGNQSIQPVHISDLVKAVERCIDSNTHGNGNIQHNIEVDVVGPAPITIKALYQKLSHWLGFGEPRFFSLPYSLSLRFADWLGFLGNTPITKETVQMLRAGNTGSVTPFEQTFRFMPQPIDQVLTDTPAHTADRWHSRLYFVRPLLRASIAFIWLFTAVASAALYPHADSYTLLGNAGINQTWAPVMLYGAVLCNLLLGVATLLRYRIVATGLLQIALILIYTSIITLSQPEFWFHPFGPVSKNIPLLVAIWIMIILEKEQ
ncbi:MAG: SDR family NAD(P)-dependent oxidoreductase [Chromatiales bacterium]|nr:SDR family NAD(P)-dependent oxidoreductase [Chromatiales bacterium]